MKTILAVGDCNTLGANELERKGYPERLGELLSVRVVNKGHTMATSREGIHLLTDHLDQADCVLIQFGLVDSYRTFRYSPYVLYYPDNFIRKQLRALTKKFKKTCRKWGLNRTIGEINVVPIGEYEQNIRSMVTSAHPRQVILIDTIPNLQQERNGEIRRYNQVLQSIAKDYAHCTTVSLYDEFHSALDRYYMDSTHCNDTGYAIICERIAAHIQV